MRPMIATCLASALGVSAVALHLAAPSTSPFTADGHRPGTVLATVPGAAIDVFAGDVIEVRDGTGVQMTTLDRARVLAPAQALAGILTDATPASERATSNGLQLLTGTVDGAPRLAAAAPGAHQLAWSVPIDGATRDTVHLIQTRGAVIIATQTGISAVDDQTGNVILSRALGAGHQPDDVTIDAAARYLAIRGTPTSVSVYPFGAEKAYAHTPVPAAAHILAVNEHRLLARVNGHAVTYAVGTGQLLPPDRRLDGLLQAGYGPAGSKTAGDTDVLLPGPSRSATLVNAATGRRVWTAPTGSLDAIVAGSATTIVLRRGDSSLLEVTPTSPIEHRTIPAAGTGLGNCAGTGWLLPDDKRLVLRCLTPGTHAPITEVIVL